MTAAIYARVSTEKQDYSGQIAELRDYARRNDWTVVEYFEKESAKIGSNRPVFKQLLEDAALKKFGTVLVWKVDRFGRSLSEFIANILLLDQLGIRFVACAGGIDTDKRNPFSKLLMNLLAMFAEFEIDIIHERTAGGQKRYRELYERGAVGKDKPRQSRSGKNLPVGRPKAFFDRGHIQGLREQGMSWRKIAKELGANQSTVRLALKKAA